MTVNGTFKPNDSGDRVGVDLSLAVSAVGATKGSFDVKLAVDLAPGNAGQIPTIKQMSDEVMERLKNPSPRVVQFLAANKELLEKAMKSK